LSAALVRLDLAVHEEVDDPLASLASLQDLLWNLAVRIEEQGRSDVTRWLENSRAALEQALRDPSPRNSADAIQAGLAGLRQALQDFLSRLPPPSRDADPLSEDAALTLSDLQQMLDEMAARAAAGDRDGALAVLQQWQAMLEALTTALQTPPPTLEALARARALEQDTQALIRAEDALLTATFQQEQNIPPLTSGDVLAQQQTELRAKLSDVINRLAPGPIPDGLRGALSSMDRAAQQLEKGNLSAAQPAESQAVEKLRAGMATLRQMAQRQFGGGVRLPNGSEQDGPGAGHRWSPGGPVSLGNSPAPHRARAVIEDIRRRLNQPQRSPQERDYLERLLRPVP